MSEAIDMIFVRRGALRIKQESSRGYETTVRQLCVDLDNPRVENVRLEDIERYMEKMLNAGFSRNAMISKACAFRTFFKSLRRHGYIVLDPSDIPIPRKEFRQPRIATDQQIAKVLDLVPLGSKATLDVRNRAMLLFLRDTGVRVSEMINMDLEDVDLANKRAVIKTAKSRGIKPVRVALWYDDCNAALEAWLKVRKKTEKRMRKFHDPQAFFVGCYGWRTGFRLTNSAVEIAFRKLSRIAGVPVLNPHSLRHRKGHNLAKSGANNSVISGVLGHASLSSSFIYTMLNNQELEDVARMYGSEEKLYPSEVHGETL